MRLGSFFLRKWSKICRKIVAEKATPEYIARGWAVGMFYGCFAPIGTQLILSLPTAFAVRGSKIGAVFGTFLTNHFSIWFVYPAQCWLGSRLMGKTLSYQAVKSAMGDILRDQSYTAMMDISEELFESFLLGGFVIAVIMTPLTYIFVRRLVIHYRERYKGRYHLRRKHPLAGTSSQK